MALLKKETFVEAPVKFHLESYLGRASSRTQRLYRRQCGQIWQNSAILEKY